MLTARFGFLIVRTLLFAVGFLPAVALDVGSTSLAQASAVGALGNRTAFFVDVRKWTIFAMTCQPMSGAERLVMESIDSWLTAYQCADNY